jgi:ABC-type phosphate transport system substrate-binding protein
MYKGISKRLVGACAAAAALAAATASPASADFTLSACAGDNMQGSGATFQAVAQSVWSQSGFCDADPTPPTVTYNSTGSGTGRQRFLDRDFAQAAFAGTDEAPAAGTTPARDTVGGLQGGTGGTDNGVLETIPVTSSSIAVIVNLPDGCAIDTPVNGVTDPRPALEKQHVEDIFDGEFDNWNQVPALDAADADCNVAIERVVRFDNSGTTFEFKKFLEEVDAASGGENDTNWPGLANTAWPDTTVNGGTAGGPAVASKVDADDGSIGYVVLADARPNFEDSGMGDDEYWLPLRAGTDPLSTAGTFADPSSAGGQASEPKGANCDNATYRAAGGGAVPTTTQSEGGWAGVSGHNSATGYSICAITYMLAWRDAADVDPQTSITQGRQRTVRDYLEYILSAAGQADAQGEDYSALPSGILSTANAGADRVCWNMNDNSTTCS